MPAPVASIRRGDEAARPIRIFADDVEDRSPCPRHNTIQPPNSPETRRATQLSAAPRRQPCTDIPTFVAKH